MNYSYSDILINNRPVLIADIINHSAVSYSPFELATFEFISKWFSEAQTFTQHTSGSTGSPKEITLSRNQLISSSKRTLQALRIKQHETALICLDSKYIAGKMMLVRALEGNLKIIATEPSANPFKNLISTNQIDFTALVPLQLQELIMDKKTAIGLSSTCKIIVGGAPINSTLEKEIQDLTYTIFATYGMTETVSHIALQQLNGPDKSPYFKVLDGISISQDERGCLVIEMPEFSEKIITNDLVQQIDQKHFQWKGRWDNVINSGGYKISPEKVEKEVERIFEQFHIDKHFFIGAVQNDKLGQKMMLLIEGNSLGKDVENNIMSALKGTLHPYEVPKVILYTPKFLLTETGKINRNATLNQLTDLEL